jgi:hypothetical protein
MKLNFERRLREKRPRKEFYENYLLPAENRSQGQKLNESIKTFHVQTLR